jgi:glycosidase
VRLSEWNASAVRGLLAGSQNVAAGAVLRSDAAGGRRSWDRLSGTLNREDADKLAKTVAAVLLTGRELPMLYFGQEVGMATSTEPVAATASAPANPNGVAPTPMQWGGERGFTSATPWIEMGPNAGTANVAFEDADKNSLLNWYRKLSELRHTHEALESGALRLVETGYPEVLAWVRRGASGKEQPVLVVCNLSGHAVLISLEEALKQIGVEARSGVEPLAVSFATAKMSYTANGIALPAYGVYVGEVLRPGLEDSAPVAVRSHRRGL